MNVRFDFRFSITSKIIKKTWPSLESCQDRAKNVEANLSKLGALIKSNDFIIIFYLSDNLTWLECRTVSSLSVDLCQLDT